MLEKEAEKLLNVEEDNHNAHEIASPDHHSSP
jgi:hypothetical protein